MKWKPVLGTVALAGVSLLAQPARADDFTPAGRPKVLINSEGVVATMVPLKAKGSHERVALLVEGSLTKLDGVVRLLLVKEQGRGADFVRVDAGGREYVALASRQSWSSTRDFTLSLPGRSAVSVYYSPKMSEKADAGRIVNRLLLRRSGRVGAKSELEKQDQQTLARAVQSANGACGSSIKAEIQSGTFNEGALKVLDVGAACGTALKAVESLCDDDPGKDAVKHKIKSVSCKLGSSLAIDLRGGKLTFTTALDTPGQAEWAAETLLKKL